MREFDVIVIGAGVAGLSAACRAAGLKAKVCLVEKDRLGGKGFNREIYSPASSFDQIKGAADRVDNHWKVLLEKKGITVVKAHGAVLGAGQVSVSGGEEDEIIKSAKIILATGSIAKSNPSIPFDGQSIISFDDIEKLAKLPENLLVVGGNRIGCEVAGVFNQWGSKVFLVDEESRLIPEQDPDIITAFEASMKKKKIKLLLNKKIISIHKDNGQINITLDGAVKFSVDVIIFAGDRLGNTSELGVSAGGVETGDRKEILVNEKLETTLGGIFSAGSVTGRLPSANLSEAQGRIAAGNAMGKDSVYDPDKVAFIVQSDPEVASVGCFAEEAHHKGYRGVEGKCEESDFTPQMGGNGDVSGLFKIVADRESRKIIGAQIFSPRASEAIAVVLLAVKKGLLIKDLAQMPCGWGTQIRGIKEAAKNCNKALKGGG